MEKKKKVKKKNSFRASTGLRLPNIAIIVFAVILIYLLVSYYNFITKNKVNFYEVTEGSIEENDRYTGLILRDEVLYKAVDDGYLNFYVRDKKRAIANSKAYYVDKEDKLAEIIKNNAGTNVSIGEDVYKSIKNELTSFSLGYNDNNFISVYDTKNSIDVKLYEYSGIDSIANIEEILKDNSVHYTEANVESSGTISFTTDTLTGKSVVDLEGSFFDESKNSIKKLGTGKFVNKNEPVFKLVNSDNWSLVVPIKEKGIERYKDRDRLTVKINSGNITLTGNYETVSDNSGKVYGKIDFDRFMIEFINDRYLKFEVQNNMILGLKIPKEAVVDEAFYLVPKEYLTSSANNLRKGFNKEVLVDGQVSTEFIAVDIFSENEDGLLYIRSEDDLLTSGDSIIKPDSDEKYTIGPTDVLEGVYSINKGYTLFKRIEVLSSDDEFDIVKKGTPYGLSVYDHILQKGAGYNEKEEIY